MPRVSDVYRNPWLKAEDLDDDEATFTITGSGLHEFTEPDGKKKSQIALDLAETDKRFGLNVTNCNVVKGIFGSDDSEDWHGEKIVLYITQTTMTDGRIVDCLRIKKKATEKLFLERRQAATKKRTEKALGAMSIKSSKPAEPVTQSELDDLEDETPPF